MSETWPAPELRERKHGLGWLALSASDDVIHIGVAASTAAEAAELYEQKRRYWATLAHEKSKEGSNGVDQTGIDIVQT